MQKKAPETTKPVPAEIDFAAYRIADPEEFGRNMLRLTEEAGKVMTGFLERSNGNTGPFSLASEVTEAAKLFAEIAQHWAGRPRPSWPRRRPRWCATTCSSPAPPRSA